VGDVTGLNTCIEIFLFCGCLSSYMNQRSKLVFPLFTHTQSLSLSLSLSLRLCMRKQNSNLHTMETSSSEHTRTASTNLGGARGYRPLEGKLGIITGASRGNNLPSSSQLLLILFQESEQQSPIILPQKASPSS
jgi:hypothetical protein